MNIPKVSRPGAGRTRTAVAAALLVLSFIAPPLRAELRAGVGTGDITPPKGTPSAGYGDRMGRPMQGVRDPLLATALAIDNGEKMLVLCGIDHIGITHDMVEEIRAGVTRRPGLEKCEIHVGSSHTHAGGGAFMDIPGVGFILAGRFDPKMRQLYIDGTIHAIIEACTSMVPARVGVGYGRATGLNSYRGDWPKDVVPRDDVSVIKVTKADGSPLGALINFPAHPTVLPGSNMEFSPDFCGYARAHIEKMIGGGVRSVYINGAQGDISPRPPSGGGDAFAAADRMGRELAATAKRVWDETETSAELGIRTLREAYEMDAQPNSQGARIRRESHRTEINLIVLNGKDAFVTIPGEMTTIYDDIIRMMAGYLRYRGCSVLGLTDDAHGYIITPQAWRHRTYESTVSFGGPVYGELVKNKVIDMLDELSPAREGEDAERVHPSPYLTGSD